MRHPLNDKYDMAFPSPDYSNGMTMLEYFAAHALKDIPDWFEPIMPEEPKLDLHSEDLTHTEQEVLRGLGDYIDPNTKSICDAYPSTPLTRACHLLSLHLKRKAWYDAKDAWVEERYVQRVVQWPWYYAMKCLEAKKTVVDFYMNAKETNHVD